MRLGEVEAATATWVIDDLVIDDDTPPDTSEEARFSVVSMTFSPGPRPTHVDFETRHAHGLSQGGGGTGVPS